MGSRGYNAGGFAYMEWVTCLRCGHKFPLGHRRVKAGDLYCGNAKACQQRRERREERERQIREQILTDMEDSEGQGD